MARGEGGVRVLLGLFVLFLVLFNALNRPNKPPGPPPAPAAKPGGAVSGPSTQHAPLLNPIAEALRCEDAPTRDGIAVAILIDTSGSMQSFVPDVGGGSATKLGIAQRTVLEIVKAGGEYRARNPARPLLIGLYEFSARGKQPNVRCVCPPAELAPEAAESALKNLRASGGTPIGDAMIQAKRDLDRLGCTKMHLLVLTDGMNTHGYQPGDVAEALAALPEDRRAAVYFVAFDTDARRFEAVREAGGMVLSASNAQELHASFSYVFTGKILAEQPMAPEPAKP